MSFIVTFIAAVFVFSAVIAIHEFGHFMVAKLCGVQVNEFSIGMGPVLCKRVRKGTQYSIRALPVGGFVALEGEESPESKQAEERSNPSAADGGSSPDRGALGIAETSPEEEKPVGIPLNEAPVWQRALIMLAGAGMNFVLGFVVLLVLVITSGKLGSTTVAQFTNNAQSCADGLREGDTILKVDGQVCRTIGDLSGCFDGTTQTHDFTVLRNGQVVHLPGVTVGPSTDADGNTIAIDFRVAALSKTPRHVLQRTGTLFRYYSTAILGGFWQLATGQVGVEELSGPIGTATTIGQAMQYGWQDVFSLLALITINIGIFNLLPIPALDGCKLIFLLIEAIFGRAAPQKLQMVVNTAGMALLLWLMVLVTMQDLTRFL